MNSLNSLATRTVALLTATSVAASLGVAAANAQPTPNVYENSTSFNQAADFAAKHQLTNVEGASQTCSDTELLTWNKDVVTSTVHRREDEGDINSTVDLNLWELDDANHKSTIMRYYSDNGEVFMDDNGTLKIDYSKVTEVEHNSDTDGDSKTATAYLLTCTQFLDDAGQVQYTNRILQKYVQTVSTTTAGMFKELRDLDGIVGEGKYYFTTSSPTASYTLSDEDMAYYFKGGTQLAIFPSDDNGTWKLDGNSITYTPAEGATGTDVSNAMVNYRDENGFIQRMQLFASVPTASTSTADANNGVTGSNIEPETVTETVTATATETATATATTTAPAEPTTVTRVAGSSAADTCTPAVLKTIAPLALLIPLGISTQVQVPGLNSLVNDVNAYFSRTAAKLFPQPAGSSNPELDKLAAQFNATFAPAAADAAQKVGPAVAVAAGLVALSYLVTQCAPKA